MSLSQISFSPRVRAIAATSMAALGATALVAIPAAATPGCDGFASSVAELQEELACAGASTAAEYTVTLTSDLLVTTGSETTYDGTADLVIDGAGHLVASQPPVPDSPAGAPFLLLGNLGGDSESTDGLSSFDVEIRNLEATGFTEQGVVSSFTTGELVLVSSTFRGNSAADPNTVGEYFALGGAITAAGEVTIRNSSFVDNVGLLGGAISTFPTALIGGEPDALPAITIDGSYFQDNSSYVAGGAVLGLGPTTITNTRFVANTAPMGGAITTINAGDYSASLTVTDSEFSGNSANIAGELLDISSGDFIGGAIYSGTDTVITDSTFTDNHSADAGGTLAITSEGLNSGDGVVPSLTLVGSEISGSSADGDAGAILAEGDLTITGSTVSDSDADWSAVVAYSSAVIESSTFANNSAADGAALLVLTETETEASVSVQNSTFSGNESAGEHSVGALAVSMNGNAWLAHNTFADNTGGVANDLVTEVFEGSTTLHGNAFATAGGGASCELRGEASTAYNFDADGSCTNDWAGTGNVGDSLDAQLGALADNGGATQTLLPLEGSPLIDVIPAAAGSPVTVDQRGVERPYGDGYDVGAVEVGPEPEDEDGSGIADSDGPQSGTDVVNFQVKTDGGTLYGTVSPAVAVTDINWTATGDLTGAPADTALPYGAAGFTIEVFEPGQSVTVTLTAPAPFTSAYKVSGDTWTSIPGATWSADGTTVTYTLTDGGDLDEDGEANGFIVDPVALAVQATFTG